MGGTIVIIVALVVIVPVSIIMTGLLFSAGLGTLIKNDVDADNEGTEMFELSKQTFAPPVAEDA